METNSGRGSSACSNYQPLKGDLEAEAREDVHADDIRHAIDHLEGNFTKRFVDAIFTPTNPFIVVSLPAVSVLLCQTAWMASTYVPLPAPGHDSSQGHEEYDRWDGRARTSAAPAPDTGQENSKRLLVLGDSLVLGIGCKEAQNAHLLAQTLAKAISREWAVNVEWRSFGIDGGNVQAIHNASKHYVRAGYSQDIQNSSRVATNSHDLSQNSMSASSSPPRPLPLHGIESTLPSSPATSHSRVSASADLCVIFCGLNDFKHLWKGRTASVFYNHLKCLLQDLRNELGPSCIMVLPAMPFEPTRFPEPLRTFVIYLSRIYDDQKRRLSHELPGVMFLPKPGVEWWRRVHVAMGNIIADDGVHPNEQGYFVYGEFLGRAIAKEAVP